MKPLRSYRPFDPATLAEPYELHAALREQAPVYEVPGIGIFLVSTYALVLEVLGDPERYSSRVGAQAGGDAPELRAVSARGYPPVDTLLTCDPPAHARYRQLVAHAFPARRVARLEDYVRRLAVELLEGFAADGAVDLVSRFAVPLPLTVIADQLGVPRRDMALFKKWSDDSVAPLGGMIPAERRRACAESIVEFQHYMVRRIEERRAEPRDDILSDLVAARVSGEVPLDLPEMLSILQQFLVAGNETTASLIASATLLLLRNPDELARVTGDPSLVPNMVEEALRLESPVQALFRVATRETDLGGVRIPTGARLAVLYASANRDAAQFPDPHRFDVRRENARSHLAFGRGEHFCIGAALARKEAVVAFETLLPRLRGLRLRKDRELVYEPSFILRRLRTLDLEWEAA